MYVSYLEYKGRSLECTKNKSEVENWSLGFIETVHEQHWIETYAKVAESGEPISYENYAQELGKYYDTYSFSPQKET